MNKTYEQLRDESLIISKAMAWQNRMAICELRYIANTSELEQAVATYRQFLSCTLDRRRELNYQMATTKVPMERRKNHELRARIKNMTKRVHTDE
jgi:hypothetical protein